MAGQGRQVFVYRVDTGGGERDVVSVLESEWVFRHGLRPEVIIGVLREGADTDRIAPDDVGENPTFLRLLSRVIFEHVGECDGMRREGEVQGGFTFPTNWRRHCNAGCAPEGLRVVIIPARDLTTGDIRACLSLCAACRAFLWESGARSVGPTTAARSMTSPR